MYQDESDKCDAGERIEKDFWQEVTIDYMKVLALSIER